MVKTKTVQKPHICGIRRLTVNIQVKNTPVVSKEGYFLLFYSFLLSNEKILSMKAFLEVT